MQCLIIQWKVFKVDWYPDALNFELNGKWDFNEWTLMNDFLDEISISIIENEKCSYMYMRNLIKYYSDIYEQLYKILI